MCIDMCIDIAADARLAEAGLLVEDLLCVSLEITGRERRRVHDVDSEGVVGARKDLIGHNYIGQDYIYIGHNYIGQDQYRP